MNPGSKHHGADCKGRQTFCPAYEDKETKQLKKDIALLKSIVEQLQPEITKIRTGASESGKLLCEDYGQEVLDRWWNDRSDGAQVIKMGARLLEAAGGARALWAEMKEESAAGSSFDFEMEVR